MTNLLFRDYWSKCLTPEAAKRMIEFAHDECGVKDFVADHFGEYSTSDGTQTFSAKFYKKHLD